MLSTGTVPESSTLTVPGGDTWLSCRIGERVDDRVEIGWPGPGIDPLRIACPADADAVFVAVGTEQAEGHVEIGGERAVVRRAEVGAVVGRRHHHWVGSEDQVAVVERGEVVNADGPDRRLRVERGTEDEGLQVRVDLL